MTGAGNRLPTQDKSRAPEVRGNTAGAGFRLKTLAMSRAVIRGNTAEAGSRLKTLTMSRAVAW
jgi:hypothetical protein